MSTYTTKALSAAAMVAVLALASSAGAATLRFNATGVAGISGYFEISDATFDGTSFQFVPNTEITDLSLDVFGSLFGFGDLITGSSTIVDSTGVSAIIVNGAGELANNGSKSISFFPDGYNGTAFDGDASLEFGDAFNQGAYYPVKWSTAPVAPVSLPATLPLMGAAFGAFGVMAGRRRRRS